MNKRHYIFGVFCCSVLILCSTVFLYKWARKSDYNTLASSVNTLYGAAVNLFKAFVSLINVDTNGTKKYSRPTSKPDGSSDMNSGFISGYFVDSEEENISKLFEERPTHSEDYSREQKAVLEPKKKRVRKWPNGIVGYVVDSSLNSSEKNELKLALDEFHHKTCVKFELLDNDNFETGKHMGNYVGIERNNTIESGCGESDVCMRGKGYQTATLTTSCMNKQSFVHELGHTLCLGHEFARKDANQFLDYSKCSRNKDRFQPSDKTYIDSGFFDYASQMMYKCGDCPGNPVEPIPKFCGEQVQLGLSVLDAEAINEHYNCAACFRHRWIHIDKLTWKDEKNMYSFGSVDSNGNSIFPCRAFHHGEIAIGSYIIGTNICTIPSFPTKESIQVEKYVEVLTIPGGLSSKCRPANANGDTIFEYQLHNSKVRSNGNILEEAVPSGSVITGKQGYFVGYIAFGTVVTNHRSFPGFGATFTRVNEPLQGVDAIGTAWNVTGVLDKAMFPELHKHGAAVKIVETFKVLVCREIHI